MKDTCRLLLLCGLTSGGALGAHGGGGPENALVVVDPLSADSLHIGNYYWHAREMLPNSVLFLDPDAASYAEWVATVQPGFLGELAQRSTRGHVDYVLVTPGNSFFVSASGLVGDLCVPVRKFSIASCFTLSQMSGQVLSGSMTSIDLNMFYSTSGALRWFDSETRYRNGVPNTTSLARAYFIGTMIGYTGERGNTIEDIKAMIVRSVASDGTRPTGTFTFMNNTADAARNVRQPLYASAITVITGFGNGAMQIDGTLPVGRHDVLGVMTGFSTGNIFGAPYTLLPGGFADHLTSYAGAFDVASQTKMSEWIRKGASGTAGAVEEPCNYTDKFPHPRLHAYYAQGMSLGESSFRSQSGVPFQTLYLGDPLTRRHTHIPAVLVPDAPTGDVSGVITLTPAATTTAPATSISSLELMIDGVVVQTTTPGNAFTIDTHELDDGWHDVRVLAYDSSTIRSVGRWVGGLTVSNWGRAATVDASPSAGSLTTTFVIDVDVEGPEPDEVRVVHQGRVVASRIGSGAMQIHGRLLGAGPVTLWADVTFPDGTRARSEPIELLISESAPSVGPASPVAFGYTRYVRADAPFVLELPATYADEFSDASYTIVTPPGGSSITGGAGAARVLTPPASSCGIDEMSFRVMTPSGTSNTATIRIVYVDPTPCPGDLNHDCAVDILDFLDFIDAFGSCDGQAGPCGTNGVNADFNRNGLVDVIDFLDYLDAFGSGCD